jgi:hypothetical protein
LGNGKNYVLEVSLTKIKLLIIAARKSKHYILEFPKKQGKKIIMELGGTYNDLAKEVRFSKSKVLYIKNLQKLLYPQNSNFPDINTKQFQSLVINNQSEATKYVTDERKY